MERFRSSHPEAGKQARRAPPPPETKVPSPGPRSIAPNTKFERRPGRPGEIDAPATAIAPRGPRNRAGLASATGSRSKNAPRPRRGERREIDIKPLAVLPPITGSRPRSRRGAPSSVRCRAKKAAAIRRPRHGRDDPGHKDGPRRKPPTIMHNRSRSSRPEGLPPIVQRHGTEPDHAMNALSRRSAHPTRGSARRWNNRALRLGRARSTCITRGSTFHSRRHG